MQWVRSEGPTAIAVLLTTAGTITLGIAYGFQYVGSLQPCQLCLYQRWSWWIAVLLGLIAINFRGRELFQRIAVGYAAISILSGAVIAIFHVGVEQFWWEGHEICTGVGESAITIDALKKQIMNTPVTRCDDTTWALFDITMAGYNAFVSITAGMGGLILLHLTKWRPTHE